MRKYAIILAVALVAFLGCFPVPTLTVTLESPANGSTVDSLTPILAWTCSESGASYRIQVASDGNFQNLVIDASNIGAPSYAVPSGKLSHDQAYYWRVNASKGGQTSDWSVYWSFKTPGGTAGTILVNATLDGSPWEVAIGSGVVNYTLTGPKEHSSSTVPQTFTGLPQGTYTLGYNSGGPTGATLVSITPSATQSLSSGGSLTFTMNFKTQPAGSIWVNATLDGASWSGQLRYTLSGPYVDSSSSVPDSFSNCPAGTYTVGYTSSGPSGATLVSITPSPTQNLSSGGTLTFTLNFHSQATSSIYVNANLDGSSWSGQVNYTIHGPKTDSRYAVPESFGNLPAGTYSLHYNYGGPAGATLTSITPAPTRTLSSGGSITFTMNFSTQASGTIYVNATLDGSTWSGQVNYTIHGPKTDSSYSVPDTFGGLPPGTYTLSYSYGGPTGATLGGITPSPRQSLPAGGTLSFTMNFHSQAAGTIYVNATLDGSPWQTAIGSGPISYTIHGPKTDSSDTVPDSFSELPAGTYTLGYNSGGPTGATLGSITPSPRQSLPSRGSITFTMNFHSEARGTVHVRATLDGTPWSGEVTYTLAGPYVDAKSYVPDMFSDCPSGSYTLSYSSGGPHQSVLEGISPSSTQNLSSGGSITFTLEFTFVSGILPPVPPN